MEGRELLEDAALRFEEEAKVSGLALPTARRFEPRLAAVGIAILVAVSLTVGYATNWFEVSRTAPNPLSELPGCSGGGTAINVATEAGASPTLAAVWPTLASAFSSATGGCLSVTTHSTATGLTELASEGVDAVIGPQLPGPPGLASLAAETYDVPLLVSPVVLLANLPGTTELNLSANALAGAYLGTVHNWSDPALTSVNPALRWSGNVTVVHLQAPSGADAVFSTYLAEWNARFRSTVGSGANVSWPVGVAASASNVTAVVASIPGAIGFSPTDVCPSLPSGVVCAALQTGPTTFVAPVPAEVSAAASLEANSSAALHGDWTNATGVAPTNSTVYPMVETTYAVVYRDLGTAYGSALGLNASKWLIALLFWVAADTAGTAGYLAQTQGYDPLSGALAITAEETALNVTYLGNWILIPASALQEGTSEGGNETGEF